MKLTAAQKSAIARLTENESLTGNLADNDARALLEWAQREIIANTDGKLVQAAVAAANESGAEGAQTLLAQATAFLTQQLSARGINAAPVSNSSAPTLQPTDNSAPVDAAATRQANAASTPHDSACLNTSGQAGSTSSMSAQADGTTGALPSASVPPASSPPPPSVAAPELGAAPVKKPRRKKKPTKK